MRLSDAELVKDAVFRMQNFEIENDIETIMYMIHNHFKVVSGCLLFNSCKVCHFDDNTCMRVGKHRNTLSIEVVVGHKIEISFGLNKNPVELYVKGVKYKYSY